MRVIGVKVKGSGVKLCQGECVRRITLVVTLAGLWDNIPGGGSGGIVIEGGI